MGKLSTSIAMVCISSLSACITTPPLEQATGTPYSDIMIKDVVQRVKCELAYAFDKKTEERDFLWLASWTAHIDLTLEINDSAGITPNGSYTSFGPNAVNRAAGPSAFPPTAARSIVPQFFTFGAGATLNSQAVRTETLSFTLALDELKDWRRKQELIESDPSFPIENRVCNPEWRSGVLGSLGLQEWVDSAFFPVQAHALEAGIHPQPLSQKPGSVPSNKTSPTPTPKGGAQAREECKIEEIRKYIDKWRSELNRIDRSIEAANAAVTAADKTITSSASSLNTKISTLRIQEPSYRYVLSENIKRRIGQIKNYQSIMWNYVTNSAICVSRLKDITSVSSPRAKDDEPGSSSTLANVRAALKNIDEAERALSKNDCPKAQLAYTKLLQNDDINTLLKTNDDKNALACAKLTQQDADNSVMLAAALPDQIDPPVDSILHSVNFVITYGANISPESLSTKFMKDCKVA